MYIRKIRHSGCNYNCLVYGQTMIDIFFEKLEHLLTYLGGTFFLLAGLGSAELLSEDCGDSSDFFLAAFSAALRPFTSITVTKSPACDAGRFLAGVLFDSTSTEINIFASELLKLTY